MSELATIQDRKPNPETPNVEALWRPHPGPQTAFLAAGEFEGLYGGAAGGGKSDALLYGGLRQIRVPVYRALLLRQSFPELRDLMDRAAALFPQLGAVWSEQQKRWRFPSGATYEFGFCATYNDVQRYQGQEFTYIAFDELGNVADERVWTYLISRCRAKEEALVLMMRASANPGGAGHGWLKRRFIDACDNGARTFTDPGTALTRRFVPARVTDNPTLVKNNPLYVAQLRSLPEMQRRQLLDGDWTAGSGMALSELNRAVHLCDVFEPPAHWTRFGALDWGFAHPWVFVWLAADEEGNVVCCDTIRGRHHQPREIAERILARLAVDRLLYIHAGHDCWADVRARGENVPTIAEQFQECGILLSQANISRRAGLNNLRRYLAWRGPDGKDGTPALRFMRTEGNSWLFDQLETMVCDPDDPEDALKINANRDTGEGGDDGYDCLRYAMASRPPPAGPPPDEGEFDAWSREALEHEMKEGRRVKRHIDHGKGPIPDA
ncbi:hypothetical protein LCGC14_2098380, partial [marine sediment metagenome]